MFKPYDAVYSYNSEFEGNNFGTWNIDMFLMGKILLSVCECHVSLCHMEYL
jgi:hypothetical protein